MEIDSEGNVVNSRICDSVINSKKKMTYDDVNRILEDGIVPKGYEKFKDVLLQMDKLSKIIGAKKFDNGEVTFFSTETNVEIDKDGKAAGVSKRTSLSAEKLIERFMILANETVASYVDMMDLPFVYRVHEGPNPIKLKEALKIINTLGYSIPESKIMKSPRLIKDILDKKFNDQSGLVYGIGHAVYTLSDPRCQILSKQCKQLAIEKNRLKEYELYHRFEELAIAEIKARKGINVCANIDFYSGLVYDMLGLSKDLYTLMFVIGRSVGWVAHNIENKLYSGKIIRPAGKYVGEKKEYIKMENR